MIKLNALVIEDNPKTLEELFDTLPSRFDDCEIVWTGCTSFDEAVEKIAINRYELIITDIYIDAKGHKKSHDIQDTGAQKTIAAIRQYRFCPILAVTDGSKPERFPESPFIRYADKTDPNIIDREISELIATQIPRLAKQIHDDIDKDASQYLWLFLEKNWESIPHDDPKVLERLLRRRSSILLSRLDAVSQNEIAYIEALEFYIYPSIAGDEFRLGEVIRCKQTGDFHVILTPHCHLTVQDGDTEPRADYVLTVKTVDALDDKFKSRRKSDDDENARSIRRRLNGEIGKPQGRYWYLPGFLEIPDLYCDFLQMESLGYSKLKEDFDRVAVLDTPFAEALQNSFTTFYSAIGTPNLLEKQFERFLK